MKYAGFWIRAGAYIIDGIIIFPINTYVLSFMSENSPGRLLVYLIWWGYTAWLTSSSLQGTLGKKVLGLKVVGLDGGRVSFARASVRFFASILSGLILGIGYVMAAFNPKKQALHDQIAGTFVIKNTPSGQEPPVLS
jgi:uncharacterized RDD family membrane protein YckC